MTAAKSIEATVNVSESIQAIILVCQSTDITNNKAAVFFSLIEQLNKLFTLKGGSWGSVLFLINQCPDGKKKENYLGAFKKILEEVVTEKAQLERRVRELAEEENTWYWGEISEREKEKIKNTEKVIEFLNAILNSDYEDNIILSYQSVAEMNSGKVKTAIIERIEHIGLKFTSIAKTDIHSENFSKSTKEFDKRFLHYVGTNLSYLSDLMRTYQEYCDIEHDLRWSESVIGKAKETLRSLNTRSKHTSGEVNPTAATPEAEALFKELVDKHEELHTKEQILVTRNVKLQGGIDAVEQSEELVEYEGTGLKYYCSRMWLVGRWFNSKVTFVYSDDDVPYKKVVVRRANEANENDRQYHKLSTPLETIQSEWGEGTYQRKDDESKPAYYKSKYESEVGKPGFLQISVMILPKHEPKNKEIIRQDQNEIGANNKDIDALQEQMQPLSNRIRDMRRLLDASATLREQVENTKRQIVTENQKKKENQGKVSTVMTRLFHQYQNIVEHYDSIVMVSRLMEALFYPQQLVDNFERAHRSYVQSKKDIQELIQKHHAQIDKNVKPILHSGYDLVKEISECLYSSNFQIGKKKLEEWQENNKESLDTDKALSKILLALEKALKAFIDESTSNNSKNKKEYKNLLAQALDAYFTGFRDISEDLAPLIDHLPIDILNVAIRFKNVGFFDKKALVEKYRAQGGDLNKGSLHSQTLLHSAIQENTSDNSKLGHYLLEEGASFTLKNSAGLTALSLILKQYEQGGKYYLLILEQIFTQGVDAAQHSDSGNNSLLIQLVKSKQAMRTIMGKVFVDLVMLSFDGNKKDFILARNASGYHALDIAAHRLQYDFILHLLKEHYKLTPFTPCYDKSGILKIAYGDLSQEGPKVKCQDGDVHLFQFMLGSENGIENLQRYAKKLALTRSQVLIELLNKQPALSQEILKAFHPKKPEERHSPFIITEALVYLGQVEYLNFYHKLLNQSIPEILSYTLPLGVFSLVSAIKANNFEIFSALLKQHFTDDFSLPVVDEKTKQHVLHLASRTPDPRFAKALWEKLSMFKEKMPESLKRQIEDGDLNGQNIIHLAVTGCNDEAIIMGYRYNARLLWVENKDAQTPLAYALFKYNNDYSHKVVSGLISLKLEFYLNILIEKIRALLLQWEQKRDERLKELLTTFRERLTKVICDITYSDGVAIRKVIIQTKIQALVLLIPGIADSIIRGIKVIQQNTLTEFLSQARIQSYSNFDRIILDSIKKSFSSLEAADSSLGITVLTTITKLTTTLEQWQQAYQKLSNENTVLQGVIVDLRKQLSERPDATSHPDPKRTHEGPKKKLTVSPLLARNGLHKPPVADAMIWDVSGQGNNCGLFALALGVKKAYTVHELPKHLKFLSVYTYENLQTHLSNDETEKIGKELRQKWFDAAIKDTSFRSGQRTNFLSICKSYLKDNNIQTLASSREYGESEGLIKGNEALLIEIYNEYMTTKSQWDDFDCEQVLKTIKDIKVVQPVIEQFVKKYQTLLCGKEKLPTKDKILALFSDENNQNRGTLLYKKKLYFLGLQNIDDDKLKQLDASKRSYVNSFLRNYFNIRLFALLSKQGNIALLHEAAVFSLCNFNKEGGLSNEVSSTDLQESIEILALNWLLSKGKREQQFFEAYCQYVKEKNIYLSADELGVLAKTWGIHLEINFTDAERAPYKTFEKSKIPALVTLINQSKAHWQVDKEKTKYCVMLNGSNTGVANIPYKVA